MDQKGNPVYSILKSSDTEIRVIVVGRSFNSIVQSYVKVDKPSALDWDWGIADELVQQNHLKNNIQPFIDAMNESLILEEKEKKFRARGNKAVIQKVSDCYSKYDGISTRDKLKFYVQTERLQLKQQRKQTKQQIKFNKKSSKNKNKFY
jgi:hypothetical protein